MAQDTITLTLKVKQDGKGFKLVGQEADKAAKSLDNTARSARSADRNLRGAAGMSSNATKNFSKMQQGISSGLVPAYAALAANVFAVTAAFGILNRSQAIKQLNEGLMFTGRAAGQNLSIVLHHNDGSQESFEVAHTFNEAQIAWFKAGSALNLIRKNN